MGIQLFFVGATFGSTIATFLKLPVSSVAALGMIGVFCGATSLLLTAIMMSIEYFGSLSVIAIIIVMLVSYILSGFYELINKSKLSKEKKMLLEGEIKA